MAMIKGVESNVKKAEDLDRLANTATREITDVWGKASVRNYIRMTEKVPTIHHVELSTKTEDLSYGTDAWTFMDKKAEYPIKMIPTQIKSDDDRVKEFKSGPKFKHANEIMIVINSNPKRGERKIVRDISGELKRIRNKLTLLKGARRHKS